MTESTAAAEPKFADLKTKKARITFIRNKIATDDKWAIRALQRVYANLTADEQSIGATVQHNGIGFTGSDAEFLTSLAQQFERRGSLSPKQIAALRKAMPKYARQLEAVAA